MGMHQCFNKGCQNGNTFAMDENEEKWHMEKFGHYPKSCPPCRAWKKAQMDYQYSCSACLAKRVVPKQKIIGYHRYVGVWEKPTLCRLCKDDAERATRKRLWHDAHMVVNNFYYGYGSHPSEYLLANPKSKLFGRKDRRGLVNARQYIEAWTKAGQATSSMMETTVDKESLQKISSLSGTTPVQVATDPAFYRSLSDGKGRDRLEHIMRHQEKGILKTQDENHQALRRMNEIAMSSDPNRIVEFRDSDQGYLVKYDMNEGVVVVIHDRQMTNRPQPPPPPAYVITSYKPHSANVAKKIAGISKGSQWLPNLMK